VKAAQALGVKSLSIQADSAEPSAVVAAVEQTVAQLRGIDILMNNAGVAVMAPLDDFKLADFDRTFAINVRAVFVATQAAAKHMKEGGRIINIGSTNAERMPFANGGVYAMSKSALQGLVQGLSRDLGPRGITINNVQPGPVDTELNPASGEFAETLKGFMALLPRFQCERRDAVGGLLQASDPIRKPSMSSLRDRFGPLIPSASRGTIRRPIAFAGLINAAKRNKGRNPARCRNSPLNPMLSATWKLAMTHRSICLPDFPAVSHVRRYSLRD
jgi:NAD(P)-dependent dehydrogenase (short-subunit alcohol dehydrogenase family)